MASPVPTGATIRVAKRYQHVGLFRCLASQKLCPDFDRDLTTIRIAIAGHATVDVVKDQRTLCLGDRTLDRLELRCLIKARSTFLDYRDPAPQVTLGAFQPGRGCRVTCLDVGF